MFEEQTVGEHTRNLAGQDPKTKDREVVGGKSSWVDSLVNLVKRKPKTTAATVAAALAGGATVVAGATGHMDTVSNVAEIPLKPIEMVLPNESDSMKTPTELLAGTMNVKIDGLNGRLAPNDSGDIVDWDTISLVTHEFNPEDGKTYEKLMPLSGTKGFTVDNPLFVPGQNADGGAEPGRWAPIPAKTKDGHDLVVYISKSQQTYGNVETYGDFIDINYKKMEDGKEVIVPKDTTKEMPNGAINSVIPLVEEEPQPGE